MAITGAVIVLLILVAGTFWMGGMPPGRILTRLSTL